MSSYRGTGLPNDFFLLYLPTISACISTLLHTYQIFHPFRPSLLDHLNTYILVFSEGTNHSSQIQYMFVPQSGISGSTHIRMARNSKPIEFLSFLIANKCVQILVYSIKVQIYYKILLICLYRTMSCRNQTR